MRYIMFVLAVFAVLSTPVSAWAADKENVMLMELKTGTVKINLREDLAPGHVERIKTLIGEQFYDGIIFHRVIDGFMAQTGDPTGTGMGGSEFLICGPNSQTRRLSAALWAWPARNIQTVPTASFSSALTIQHG